MLRFPIPAWFLPDWAPPLRRPVFLGALIALLLTLAPIGDELTRG